MSDITREQILSMDAGRELDALVAEKVMGYKLSEKYADGVCYVEWMETPYDLVHRPFMPSSNITDTWEVVEELNGKYGFSLGRAGDYFEPDRKWNVRIGKNEWEEAETAPLAISRASLLAVLNL